MILCVTGPMAAGKNAVCRILEERGFIALDADRQVHGAIEKAAPEIIKTFSNEAKAQNITLTDENGRINRRELGRLLFTSKELLSKQESIVYPVIIEETKRFIQKQQELKSDADIILNATVLYKTPELLNLCKYIIYVDAPKITRIVRSLKRDRMPLRQILGRFASQKNLFSEYKKTGVPIIKITNAGSEKKLETSIKSLSILQ
ncbi:MAG: dephospho-CoA kinase [Treponema porcinum]|uniref:dephospho-CoA kinase n=1 Tax=Treponema porcinum TaxID=261392 RepID=UPI002355FCEB|nr:dephospho-CoA kinase [Treponema porcinum]MCI7081137.1 dephospho-CoA kinase [Treponema porcinum]MDY4189490.1 dephospho-CoA kinase [Treponema porcinum]MDY5048591.1 dephospho-CoA kinase [Treponema porcinum]